ncbi:MAG: hypothetical protein KBT12_08190 [Bacteroidales bacterium]|nr:hypothetical protein [Candidatus Physcousia equi]
MLIKNKIIDKLLKQNERLHDKRHPMFERNRFVKFLAYFMIAYYGAILLLLGVSLPVGMSQVYHGVAGFHVLDGWFFILLIIDFWLRFIFQETPANQTRPYSLLPISRRYLMRRYMLRAAFSAGNLFWSFFLVPFGIISVWHSMSLWAVLGWWLGWWLLIVMNSYAYLLIRALCTRHVAWCLLPLALHAGILLIALLPTPNPLDMPCTLFMYAFAKWELWAVVAVVAVIVLFYRMNVWVQGSILYDEVGKKEEVVIKKSHEMSFLNRFGIVGEYLKLELRMKTRNRMLKVQMFVLLACMLLLSGILYFSDIYDGLFMRSFICLYDYIVPGATALVTIMCHEGNYMDLLMSHRESVLDLLTAKYYFFSALLLFPFLLLIPVCLAGKISFLMSLGYLFFVVGIVYPCLFQMAAYNKETLPLNAKLGSKQGNGKQNIVTLTIMFLPIALERACVSLLGDTWGYLVLIALGGIGVLTHRQWLRFAYQQFMKRRYENMEGFRASRQ